MLSYSLTRLQKKIIWKHVSSAISLVTAWSRRQKAIVAKTEESK